jgi:hypothetical protein
MRSQRYEGNLSLSSQPRTDCRSGLSLVVWLAVYAETMVHAPPQQYSGDTPCQPTVVDLDGGGAARRFVSRPQILRGALPSATALFSWD